MMETMQVLQMLTNLVKTDCSYAGRGELLRAAAIVFHSQMATDGLDSETIERVTQCIEHDAQLRGIRSDAIAAGVMAMVYCDIIGIDLKRAAELFIANHKKQIDTAIAGLNDLDHLLHCKDDNCPRCIDIGHVPETAKSKSKRKPK